MATRTSAQRWILVFAAIAGASAFASQTSDLPNGFIERRADQVEWRPNPAVAGGQIAVLVGDPAKQGPLVLRIKMPPNIVVQPHTHPDTRTYTVLQGEWKLGFGERYDPTKLRTYPAGSMYHLPAGIPHFQAAGSAETIVQIQSIGPTRTDFIKRD
jgi:quercetin dioxygenase-like cupin family protein